MPEFTTKMMTRLRIGDVVKGKVYNCKSNYAQILVDDKFFILPYNELSWSRDRTYSHFISQGEEISSVVVKIEQCQVMVSLKRLMPNPWLTINDRYQLGMIVTGKITRISYFGAFIEIESGVSALLPKNEIRTDQELREGQNIEVKIISINPEERKMSLSTNLLSD